MTAEMHGAETAASAGRKATEKQKIPASAWTQVKLTAAINDPNSRFDLVNGWYKVPATGIYAVTGLVTITLTATEYLAGAGMWVNGAEKMPGLVIKPKWAATANAIPCACAALSLTEGDKVELRVYQESGAERELQVVGTQENQLAIVRVG